MAVSLPTPSRDDLALIVRPGLEIPLSEFEFTFIRSSGPGGQNVNKVSSKARLRWPVEETPSLPQEIKERFTAQLSPPIDHRRRIDPHQPTLPRPGEKHGRLPVQAPRDDRRRRGCAQAQKENQTNARLQGTPIKAKTRPRPNAKRPENHPSFPSKKVSPSPDLPSPPLHQSAALRPGFDCGMCSMPQAPAVGSIFCGLHRPAGLNACRTSAITARSVSVKSWLMKEIFSTPMPCSPVTLPPSRCTWRESHRWRACTRWTCSALRSSNSRIG